MRQPTIKETEEFLKELKKIENWKALKGLADKEFPNVTKIVLGYQGESDDEGGSYLSLNSVELYEGEEYVNLSKRDEDGDEVDVVEFIGNEVSLLNADEYEEEYDLTKEPETSLKLYTH